MCDLMDATSMQKWHLCFLCCEDLEVASPATVSRCGFLTASTVWCDDWKQNSCNEVWFTWSLKALATTSTKLQHLLFGFVGWEGRMWWCVLDIENWNLDIWCSLSLFIFMCSCAASWGFQPLFDSWLSALPETFSFQWVPKIAMIADIALLHGTRRKHPKLQCRLCRFAFLS